MVGEKVVVEYKTQTGVDDYNSPIFTTTTEDVANVLIAPGTTTDYTDSTRPTGASVIYSLYFPKPFSKSLRGARVQVYGEWFDVVGDPKPYKNPMTPTDWWLPVEVGVVNG